MVGAFIVKTTREQARVATIGIHSPNGWRRPGLGAAENNVRPSGDSLARKSQTAGPLCVRRATLPSCG